ncbi:hypothetical protein TNCV_596141 [Trichonephila clavipes]|nr:hypothetical protein TNCV_596141 [Trichonephila clavipes]
MAERRDPTKWLPMDERVIRYEWTDKTGASVIHGHIQTVYGEEVIFCQVFGYSWGQDLKAWAISPRDRASRSVEASFRFGLVFKWL